MEIVLIAIAFLILLSSSTNANANAGPLDSLDFGEEDMPGPASKYYDRIIRAAAAKYSVPVAWIKTIITVESSWDPNAFRYEPRINDSSYGLMQLLVNTAINLGFKGEPNRLFLPTVNIDLGTKLLGQLRAAHGDDVRRIYSAYNSGNPNNWTTNPMVAEHVRRFMAAYEIWSKES